MSQVLDNLKTWGDLLSKHGLRPFTSCSVKGYFSIFMSAAKDRDMLGGLLMDGPDAHTALKTCFFAALWKQHGRPIFKLTPSLLASLLLTQPRGLVSEVRLPFPAFLVQLPNVDSPFSILGDKDAPREPANLMLVNQVMESNASVENREVLFKLATAYGAGLEFMSSAPSPEQAVCSFMKTFSSSANEWWRTQIISQLGSNLEMHDESPILPLVTCESFSQHHSLLAANSAMLMDTKDNHVMAAVRRLLINLCFYIQMKKEQAYMPSPVQKKKGKRGGFSIYRMGGEVHLPSQLLSSAYAYAHAGTQPAGWEMRKRFVVRGHWRSQPWGENRSKRRRIWIQPHWKGPETSEELERLYKVETFNEAGLTDS